MARVTAACSWPNWSEARLTSRSPTPTGTPRTSSTLTSADSEDGTRRRIRTDVSGEISAASRSAATTAKVTTPTLSSTLCATVAASATRAARQYATVARSQAGGAPPRGRGGVTPVRFEPTSSSRARAPVQ